MKSIKLVIQILMLAAVVTSVTACSKSGSKSSARATARGYQANGPGAAPGVNASSCTSGGTWGEITNFSEQSLYSFVGQEVPGVSNLSNQASGIRFTGAISSSPGGRGELDIYIFGDAYNQTGEYLYAPFSCSSTNLNNVLTITCLNDHNDDVIFRGSEQGNVFSGQVLYNGSAVLGNFRISSCGFFTY